MTAKTKDLLSTAFNRLSEKSPDLAVGRKPLGMGQHALVLENEDGSVTKIYFRPTKAEWAESMHVWLNDDISALSILTGTPLQTVETPFLISKPEYLDGNDHYLAHYRMSRVSGTPLSCIWYGNEEPNQTVLQNSCYSAGRLLARFHREVRHMDFSHREYGSWRGHKIKPVAILKDETNKALEKVEEYRKECDIYGVIHGDYHSGNIMTDDRGTATGLIDFSMIGPNSIYHDFCGIPTAYRDDFFAGYEDESEYAIDEQMVTIASLSSWMDFLTKTESDDLPEYHTEAIVEINNHLNKLINVTGYKP